MTIIVWRNEYSVGIPKLDEQHKTLFNLVNELHTAMIQGNGKELVGTTLAQLIEYTRMHFATEEKYMEETLYPGLELHKKEHDEFQKIVLNFRSQFHAGSLGLSISIMNYLRDWLTEHIMGTDQKYAAYFASKGIK